MVQVNLKRLFKDRVPLFKWLPQYKVEDALGDLVAGFTVGLTLIPQVFLKPSVTSICYLNNNTQSLSIIIRDCRQ